MYKQAVSADKAFCIHLVASGTVLAVADGTWAFVVPATMDGYALKDAVASILSDTLGAGDPTKLQIRKIQVSDGVSVNMLSTELQIDAGEQSSLTSATAYVMDTANNGISEGDIVFIDIEQVPATAPKGLGTSLTFGA